MATPTLATRLPEPLLRAVRLFAKRRRLGPSEALRAIVAEWVAGTQYPAIEFRDGPAGRRPALRGGPDVWEVAMVARDTGQDAEALRRHFGAPLSAAALGDAVAYAGEHRDEMEAWIEENDRLGQELERASRADGRAAGTRFEPERLMREAAARMTVERKLDVARRLRELAWDVKAAAIRARSPDLSEGEVEDRVREVFRDAIR